MVGPTTTALVLLAALGLFAIIGFRARGAGGLEDYVVARDSQPANLLGLSFLASGMGAWILFAPPDVGAHVGVLGVVGYALGAAGPVLAFGLLGPRLRAVVPAGHTLTEFVRVRFGRGFHTLVVAISVLYMTVFLTAELTAVAGVTAILSDVDGRVVIVAVAAVTAAYTAYGGLRASLRTDRWQGWLLVALLVLGAGATVAVLREPAAALRAGGLARLDRAGVEVAATLLIAVTAANLFHQGYWQRVWAARDDGALRRGAGMGVALIIPVVLIVGALGMVAAGTGADLGQPPVPFFVLLAGAPAWVGPAVLLLSVTLVASSADTLQNGLVALLVAERPVRVRTARLATVALLVPVVLVALQGLSVLRLFLIADLLCAAAAAPALLGLWSRTTARGASAGVACGLVAAVLPGWLATGSLTGGVRLATFPAGVPTLPPFLAALLASLLVTVAVSVAGRRSTDVTAVGARVPALDSR